MLKCHYQWTAAIIGPEDSPYADGTFYLGIIFTKDYPFSKPIIYFKTKIYHPNIGFDGKIGLDIICCQWVHSLSIEKILYSIRSLMKEPNLRDTAHILSPKVAREFENAHSFFERTARDWTKKYAM